MACSSFQISIFVWQRWSGLVFQCGLLIFQDTVQAPCSIKPFLTALANPNVSQPAQHLLYNHDFEIVHIVCFFFLVIYFL